jgi:hypothetical protein
VQALNRVAQKHPNVLPEVKKNFTGEIALWKEGLNEYEKTGGPYSAYLMTLYDIYEDFEETIDIKDMVLLCSVGLYMRSKAEVCKPPHPNGEPTWPDASETLARIDGLFRTSSASK